MKLTVKRMRFGDCCVLEGRRRLIVDCGSDSQDLDAGRSAQAFAYAAIQREINDLLPTDVLISHLHSDHFCGFLSLPDGGTPLSPGWPVETAYLPWTVCHGTPLFSGALARLLVTAPPRSFALRLSARSVALLKRLEHSVRQIQMVQAGDRISLGGRSALDVLWPRVELAAGLPLRNGLSFLARDRQLAGEYRLLAEREAEGARREERIALLDLLDAGDRTGEALAQYLILLHGEALFQASRREALHRLQDSLEPLEAARWAFWGNGADLTPLQLAVAAFSTAQYHALIDGLNATSVVCQLGERALFSGDAPPKVFRLLRNEGALHPAYRVVKLPHHGTGRYFTPALPAAEHYIVSNGGYASRKVGTRVLEALAVACPGCVFHCTDAHVRAARDCQYVGDHGGCHPACIPILTRELVLNL